MQFTRHFHARLDSTSDEAFRAHASGVGEHGDLFVAAEQTKGRGRRGRIWYASPGEGLALSVLLLPEHPPHPAALTLAGGLACFDLARGLGLDGAQLKWPNDLVVAGAKLAGVLVESRGLDLDAPHYVLGIGVNIRQRRFPPDLLVERAATSLALEGHELTLDDAEARLTRALGPRVDQALAGEAQLERDFESALGLMGRRVEARDSKDAYYGVFVGFSLARGVALDSAEGRRIHLPVETLVSLTAV